MPVDHYTAPQLICDDVLHWAETYSGPPFHAALMDPPYHLSGGFMGAQWDKDGPDAIAFRPETWAALARHLLPGAFVMAFASSRGWHRLACAMEEAGLILHPSIFGWGFGSGFPKATRIDTQVDGRSGQNRGWFGAFLRRWRHERHMSQHELCERGGWYDQVNHGGAVANWELGYNLPTVEQYGKLVEILDLPVKTLEAAEREVVGKGMSGKTALWDESGTMGDYDITAPATPLAQTWAGHRYGGQVLKPALEPIIVAQVPYSGRPVDSITATGAGALWIDGARIGGDTDTRRKNGAAPGGFPHNDDAWTPHLEESGHIGKRWPANLALVHLPGCTPVGMRQAPLGQHGANASNDSVNVSIIQDTVQPNVLSQAQHFHICITRAHPGSIVEFRAVNFDSDMELRQEQIDHAGTCCANDDILMDDFQTSILQALNHFEFKSWDGKDDVSGIANTAMDGQFQRIDFATKNLTRIATKESPFGSFDTTRACVEFFTTGQTGAYDLLTLPPDAQFNPTRSTTGPGDSLDRSSCRQGVYILTTTNFAFRIDVSHGIIIPKYACTVKAETVQAYACSDGCPVAALDGQAGERKAGGSKDCRGQEHGYMAARLSRRDQTYDSYADDGPVSRFFYTADWALDVAEQLDKASPVFYCGKASASERQAGLEGRNPHPTLKPLTLLRWLATLLLPPAAYAPRRLLVPFSGTSSEMIGGMLAGFETVLGIERDATYIEIGRKRIAWWTGYTVPSPAVVGIPPQEKPPALPTGSQAQLPLF
jgi:transcriptional regulator with XRE-family HTH domain